MNRTSSPTRRHRTARRPGQRSWAYRPRLTLLEDRDLPSAVTTIFHLDPGASGLTATPRGQYTETHPLTTYSGLLAVQWDLEGRSISLLATGTAVTAGNAGNFAPDINGGDGSAPANYAVYWHFGLGKSSYFQWAAYRDVVLHAVTPRPLPLTGNGAALNFPALQNFTVAGGFVDHLARSCGFLVGCQVNRGRDNLANSTAANLAATDGTFQDLGNGTYRVTLPVAFGLNWDVFSGLNGTLVANATLPVVDLSNGQGSGDYATSVIATQGPVLITAPGAQVRDAAAGAVLTGMTVTLTNHPDGAQEKLAADLSGTNLQGAYNPATGVETITGTAAPAVYQSVLRRLTYEDTSPTPDTHDRVLQVAVSDGTNASILRASTVRVYTPTDTLRVALAAPALAGVPGSLTVTAAPDYTGTVHFASSDPQASLPPNYTFTAADHGVHTFSATFKTAGRQALWVTDTANHGIDGVQSGIVVRPAAVVRLAVVGFPSPVAAGSPGRVTVTASDAYGNAVPDYTGTVHFTSSDGRAMLPANYAFTAADQGVHTFTATLNSSGPQSLTVTDTATGSLIGLQTGIFVLTNAVTLGMTAFPSPAGAGAASNVTVTARDRNGDIATGYTGTVHFSSSDRQAALPANYTFAAADHGVHTFSVALKTAGAQSLTAGDTANGALSSTQAGIVVNPAAVASLSVTGFPSPATAGVAGMVTVTAKDVYGNTVPTYIGTVHLGSSDPRAVLPANYAFTSADHGVHTFTAALKTDLNESLTATDIANGGITGIQTIFVNPAAAARLSAYSYPSSVNAGDAVLVTVTAFDPYDNYASTYTGTLRVSSSDARAVLPANYTFTVNDYGFHAFSVILKTIGTQSITITDIANPALTVTQPGILVHPASLLVAGFPSPITAGVPGAVAVSARDAAGNIIPGYTGTVYFTSSDRLATLPATYTFTAADHGVHTFTATLTTAGQQSLSATDSTGVTGTQAGIVVNPGAAAILYAPGVPYPVMAGLPFNLTLIVQDVYGNTVPTYTGTLHFDSTDSQAVLPADYTFTAADHGQHTFSLTLRTLGFQSVTVTDLANQLFLFSLAEQVDRAIASLGVSGLATPIAAGAPGTITVTALDMDHHVVPDYVGTVHFTSSDRQAVLPFDYTFTADDHGVHTFSVALRTAGTQAITATDVSASAITGTQAGIVVNPAAVSALLIAGFPSPITAGVAGMATVTAQDAYGNVATGYTGTVHVISYDLQAVLPADYTFTAADRGVHTFSVTLKTAGPQGLGVVDKVNRALAGMQFGIVVNAVATVRLRVSGFPSSITAGNVGFLTVAAVDVYGNITPAYRGTVQFSSSDRQAMLPASFTFSAYDAGVFDLFSVTLKTAGTQWITVVDRANAAFTGTLSGIIVTPAATTKLVVTDLPASFTAGMAGSVTVAAQDAYGNTTPAYTDAIHFSSTDAQAVLPTDYTFTAADQGVHTFRVTLKTAGSQLLIARDKATTAITGAQSSIVVQPAAASALLLAGLTSPQVAGMAGSVTVTLRDPYGNIAVGYTGTVHFSSRDAQAVLPPNYSFTAADQGMHTFSVTLKTAGMQALQVTDQGNAMLTATQSGIAVTPAAASTLLVAGFPSPITAGVAGTFTVTAKDAYGNVATGYTGTVHVTSSDPQAVLPADYPFTAADRGVHSFSVTLKTAGTQALRVADKVNGALSAMQSGIVVNPATTATLIVAGLPASLTAGTAGDLTVTTKDAYGNTTPAYRGTIQFSSSDAQAGLPARYTFSPADAGVHTFRVTLKTAGTQSVKATDQANASIAGTQAGIVVTAAATATLVVTGFPASITAGTAGAITVTAKDAYGNTTLAYTGTVRVSSSDVQAALPSDYAFTAADHGVHTFSATLKTAGTQALTATDRMTAGLTGTQAGITVSPAAVHVLALTGFSSSVVAGMPFSVTLTAQDAYGNTVSTYLGTVHFSSHDPSGALLPTDYTFTAADHGVHTFANGVTLFSAGPEDVTVTDSAHGLSGRGSVTVLAAAADHFLLTTSVDDSGTVAGTPFDVTVTVQDAYGNTVPDYSGTVTFASQDPYGAVLPDDYTFTADDQGTATFASGVTLFTAGSWDVTITETSSGLSGMGYVLVTAAAADHFQILAPAQAASGTAFDVTVLAVDPYGNVDSNYQGTIHFSSTDPDPGVLLPDDYSFTAADQGMHTFAAGVTLITAGDQTLTVTDVDNGIAGSAVVTITAAGVPSSAPPGSGAASAASAAAEDSALQPPARFAAGALDAFFQQWSRHRHPDGWLAAFLG